MAFDSFKKGFKHKELAEACAAGNPHQIFSVLKDRIQQYKGKDPNPNEILRGIEAIATIQGDTAQKNACMQILVSYAQHNMEQSARRNILQQLDEFAAINSGNKNLITAHQYLTEKKLLVPAAFGVEVFSPQNLRVDFTAQTYDSNQKPSVLIPTISLDQTVTNKNPSPSPPKNS